MVRATNKNNTAHFGIVLDLWMHNYAYSFIHSFIFSLFFFCFFFLQIFQKRLAEFEQGITI